MSEKELRDALRGVPAPGGLWDRIESRLGDRQSSPPRGPRSGVGWAMAAAVAVTLGVSWLALWGREPEELALFREVCGHPERLDVRTDDLSMVQQFASQHGFTMHVAGPPAARIKVVGVRRLPGRDRLAVAYRTGTAWSALLVEPAGNRSAVKTPIRRSRDGVTTFEWRSGKQWYTLVTSLTTGAEAACGICHFDRPGSA